LFALCCRLLRRDADMCACMCIPCGMPPSQVFASPAPERASCDMHATHTTGAMPHNLQRSEPIG